MGKQKADTGNVLRNRVIERRRMHSSELTPNPANWRQHPDGQAKALAGILREVGQVGELYAYHSERNGGKLVLVDGHLRLKEAEEWDVAICDLTDAEADKVLLTRDPIAAMAVAGKDALDALLRVVQTGEEAVAGMLTELAETAGSLPVIPEPKAQQEPQLRGEHMIEIYCTGTALDAIRPTLEEWSESDGITVNIS